MAECLTLDNCSILTVDEKDTVYPQGRIVVEGDRIARLGSGDQVEARGEILDMGGALAMPGLVNTHTHSHSSIFRGLGDDLPLMDWLQKAMWPLEKFLTRESMYHAARLSCLEYIHSGITTYADQIYFADAAARAARESGLRCFLAATVFQGPSPETDDTFRAACAFIEQWRGGEKETRVYPCIGPHAPYSVDEDLFRRIRALAEKYGLLIHTHISETADENNIIMKKTGLSPVRWLESLGIFELPVLAAHSIHLDEADLSVYERCGAAVSYNPVSNLKLVSGIMPLAAMRRRGITVGIGTDGAQSNNSMDLLRDLRTGVLIQKQKNGDAAFFNAREAVRMATIDGARALRIDGETGSLRAGKKADIIFLDPAGPRLVPLHPSRSARLYSTVCYAASGGDVRDVMVEGRWVMRDRRAVNLCEEEIREAAQRASEHLMRQAGL
ncbi:MAG: amidohydrolase [Treponema sp.]|jgi:5-methylthioadenosine/S-adenosylhomocysteine deaminase|nr:amidohydrolase [Treponema sp.]